MGFFTSGTTLLSSTRVILTKRFVTNHSTRPERQTERKTERSAQTCVGLAFLHIALPECFWFGNLLTEAVWHYSQILLTHTVDFTLLLTPTTTHRALQSQSDNLVLWAIGTASPVFYCEQYFRNALNASRKSQSCVTDLLPVLSHPVSAGL